MGCREIILKNEQETLKLGQEIAKSLTAPTLIYVQGELGAGKTTFAQGLIKTLIGGQARVLSPTYAYVHSYAHEPIIHHFDLYRIDDEEKLSELGLDILLADESSIRIVEWPEQLNSMRQKPDIEVSLTKVGFLRKATIIYPSLA